MDSPAGPIVILVGLAALALGVRVLVHVVRRALARLHALRSIPLPRQPTLVSGKPSGQIEAVFLDIFDTEHRRSFDGEPKYELYSAEEIAELRVAIFQRAFARRETRILYEIEVGVPLLRKLEERDPALCAWIEERLKVHPPLFGKPYTLDDLILKPTAFRDVLWNICIGASAVLLFEQIFKSLPITILPRRLPAPRQTIAESTQSGGQRDEVVSRGQRNEDDGQERVASLTEGVLKKLETGDETAARAAIADARTAVGKAYGTAPPPSVHDLLQQLAVYEERLTSFEDAFTAETSKHMDEWAPWLREALTDAGGGANLADLGEDAVLDAFKRRARYRWVTDPTSTASRGSAPGGDGGDSGASAAPTTGDSSKQAIIDTTGEVTNASASPSPSFDRGTDKGTEIGF